MHSYRAGSSASAELLVLNSCSYSCSYALKKEMCVGLLLFAENTVVRHLNAIYRATYDMML